PKEEMRSTLAGDSVFFLFSASLSCLGVLGDNPFLGSCRTNGQCAEPPMKRHIAEDAEAAEARREKQSRISPTSGHRHHEWHPAPSLLGRPWPGCHWRTLSPRERMRPRGSKDR